MTMFEFPAFRRFNKSPIQGTHFENKTRLKGYLELIGIN